MTTKDIYTTFSPGLLTDLYQLTMGCGYWKEGIENTETVFAMHFRTNPFKGGYTIACGLQQVIEFLQCFRYTDDDIAYLQTLTGDGGRPLFEKEFLALLRKMEFSCDIDAIPEGTVVFPQEPMLRIKGPILQTQIVETAILTILNFQSLIATKSARMVQAAEGDPIFEFGLRRAQGLDGGVSASRASYIGGCVGTSNVLAGKLYNIPLKGTHAHSWVMLFEDELEAFLAYGKAMPHNCVFLADTYNSLEGVRHAIEAAKKLASKDFLFAGIRLDSGDLAYLSIEARKMLDAAGFPDAKIVATNDLDEEIISSLKQQKAKVQTWGVGTRLVTAYDQPALGGVYKLTAVKNAHGEWESRLKLSEQLNKMTNPGILQIRRYYYPDGNAMGDMIYDIRKSIKSDVPNRMIDPFDATRQRNFPAGTKSTELLVPVFRGGECVYEAPSIEEMRTRVQTQLNSFHSGVKRLINPHTYPVGLEEKYYQQKTELILKLRHMK
ncbi:MAG: nicotinate phosphoribosyltransferase [Candidatus Sumerlaeales bacterium]|nr:nicotinate phosphoribosyltransferase [Candidatus Sumerlaeales bacterium]